MPSGRRPERPGHRDAVSPSGYVPLRRPPLGPAGHGRRHRIDRGQHRPGHRLLLRFRRRRRDGRRRCPADHPGRGAGRFLLAMGVAEFSRTEPSAGSFIEFVESGLGPVGRHGHRRPGGGRLHHRHGRRVHHVRRLHRHHARPLRDRRLAWGPLDGGDHRWRPGLMVRGASGSPPRRWPGRWCSRWRSWWPPAWSSSSTTGGTCPVPLPLVRRHRGARWSVGRLPPRPVHVHRLGERPGPGRGVPRARTTVPRALMASIAIATVLFLLFAYATVTGFGYDVSSIGRSSIPFLTVADRASVPSPWWRWLAGIVSVWPPSYREQLPVEDALRRWTHRQAPPLARVGSGRRVRPRPGP